MAVWRAAWRAAWRADWWADLKAVCMEGGLEGGRDKAGRGNAQQGSRTKASGPPVFCPHACLMRGVRRIRKATGKPY